MMHFEATDTICGPCARGVSWYYIRRVGGMAYWRESRRMTDCRGVQDWFSCISCENICTSRCPLESDDVVGELAMHLRAAANLPGPEPE